MTKKAKSAHNNPIIVTEHTDYHAIRQDDYRNAMKAAVVGVARTAIDPRAAFASACIERWGMISAVPDGEDTAGRQKVSLMTPDEIVHRACDVADKAYAAFEKRGWIVKLPSIAEMLDTIEEYENSNA